MLLQLPSILLRLDGQSYEHVLLQRCMLLRLMVYLLQLEERSVIPLLKYVLDPHKFRYL